MEPVKGRVEEHISEFKKKGGRYILNISYDLESSNEVISQSFQFESRFPQIIYSAVGIHPEYVTNLISQDNRLNIDKQIEAIESIVKNHRKRIHAIGEIGLEYFQLEHTEAKQREEITEIQKIMFKRQLDIAVEYKLPVVIHCRDIIQNNQCVSDILRIVTQIGKGKIQAVFHSFTGDITELKEILSLGFYVGYNGIITYPKAQNVRDILKETPIQRILIETDCPLLPPQKVRSGKSGIVKYGKPDDVDEIIEMVSSVKNIPVEKVISETNNNFESLFLRD